MNNAREKTFMVASLDTLALEQTTLDTLTHLYCNGTKTTLLITPLAMKGITCMLCKILV